MPTIEELLSNTQKENIIEHSLNVGDVFRMNLTEEEGITPKNPEDDSRNKFFIILGRDCEGSAIGFVVINSAINPKLPLVIKDLQYPLSASKYTFLKKNSFVNCADLKVIEKSKFSSLFDDTKSKGEILPDDIEYIIATLQSSPVVEPKLLKRFGLLPTKSA